MVVLAQALVSEPRYMIIDELSLGLAPVIVERLIPTIHSVAEAGVGVLLIEQFATLALGLANRAYVMEGGTDPIRGPGTRATRAARASALRVPAARTRQRRARARRAHNPRQVKA